MNCRICGDQVDPRRVELGYDYCTKERCQQLCVKRVVLASVGVNKAADYYTTADELLPARLPAPGPEVLEEPDDLAPSSASRAAGPPVPGSHRPATTLDRLRRLEAQLDRDLNASYERFERGQITAAEMHQECEHLTAAFNRVIAGENIRYRSMLRSRRSRAR